MKKYFVRIDTPDASWDFTPTFNSLKDALTYKAYQERKWKTDCYPYREEDIKLMVIESEVEV